MSATSRRRQRGAAMVEVAITLSLFLALVFGIIEFSMAYHTWARTNEAARDAVRYAIVNDPVTSIASLTCPGGTPVTTACTGAACQPLLNVVHRVAEFVAGSQVQVRYACSGTGNPDRPQELLIPEIEVTISGVQHQFIMLGMFGLPSMTLPPARAARTGEDLYTEK